MFVFLYIFLVLLTHYSFKAQPIGRAKTLYEYDKQTEEELSFKENEILDVYDTNDQDWILVGRGDDEYGFVPSNYIEYLQQQPQAHRAQPPTTYTAQPSATPPAALNKPLPSHPTIQTNYSNVERDQQRQASWSGSTNGRGGYRREEESHGYDDNDEDERPPPMPARPNKKPSQQTQGGEEQDQSGDQNNKESQFYSWSIQEVDGRKKHRATLAIGNGSIMYSPEKSNGAPQQWDISDLITYDHEKKHVFLEFQHPGASLDLHAGSKDTADEIMAALGEAAGANRAVGLREVYMAANSTGQEIGKALYDFTAQGDDEVSVREGDNVFILDSKKSDEWWMVRTTSGAEGVMPSSYIELSAGPGGQKPEQPLAGNSSRVRSGSGNNNNRDSVGGRSRGLSDPRKKNRKSEIMPPSKSKPDPSKVRTWTDRTGSFKVDAALLGSAEGKIHLHKLNGVKIAVAANKMSVEDLEYVERVTGIQFDDDKPLVDVKRSSSRKPRNSAQLPGGPSTGSNNHGSHRSSGMSPPEPPAGGHGNHQQPSKPEYDWFGFFLDCGVDINNCQRYALNFNRDQMDESILEDISPEVLRNLGLKEGDILRVTKKLDERFDRRQKESNSGGLFSGNGGALKNNTSKPANASTHTGGDSKSQQSNGANSGNHSFEDDAWAIKSQQQPRASPNPQPQPQPQPPPSQNKPPQQPEPTGSMRDLLGIAPLEPVKTQAATTTGTPQQQQPALQQAYSGPQQQQPLQSSYTGGSSQPTMLGMQPQQQAISPLQPSYTGGGTLVNPQYVGLQQQPQQSGGLSQQRTGGGTPIPIATQLTGGNVQQPLGPFATGQSQPLGPFATGQSQPLGPFATGQSQQLTGGGGNFMSSISSPSTPFPPQNPQQNVYPQSQGNMSTPTLNNLANQFQQTSLNNTNMYNQMQQQQPLNMGFQPQPQQPFQQPQSQPQQPFQQPQQPLQGQPTGFGFGNQPTGGNNGSYPASAAQSLGMNQQPLAPQTTGPHPPVSFGGPQPLQNTPTGRRANLAAATPNNPFGF